MRLVLIIMIAIIFSCKKFDDSNQLSFRSVKKRIEGRWYVDTNFWFDYKKNDSCELKFDASNQSIKFKYDLTNKNRTIIQEQNVYPEFRIKKLTADSLVVEYDYNVLGIIYPNQKMRMSRIMP